MTEAFFHAGRVQVVKNFYFLMQSMYSLIKRRDLRRLICICVVRKYLGPVV